MTVPKPLGKGYLWAQGGFSANRMWVIFLILLPMNDTCPECLRCLKWLESCFNGIVGIPFYARISNWCRAVSTLLPLCFHPMGTYPVVWVSHCSAFRQLSAGERWKESKRFSVSSQLESCRHSSDLICADLSSSFPRLSESQQSPVFIWALSHQVIQYKTPQFYNAQKSFP